MFFDVNQKRLLIFKFCYGLPPNAFIIISVEMCKCSRTHICSSIRSLHGITTSNTHVPKNHSSSWFFLALDFKSTWKKIITIRKSRNTTLLSYFFLDVLKKINGLTQNVTSSIELQFIHFFLVFSINAVHTIEIEKFLNWNF